MVLKAWDDMVVVGILP